MALGSRSLACDLGMKVQLRMHTDSSAARGIALRKGIGRLRHLHTPLLWIQDKVASHDLEVMKCRGDENVADLGTKDLSKEKMLKFLSAASFTLEAGRHPLALKSALEIHSLES
eukprot:1910732-Amphidinium_carterae.1